MRSLMGKGCKWKHAYATLTEARKIAEQRSGESFAYECFGWGKGRHWHLTAHPLPGGNAQPLGVLARGRPTL